MTYRGHIAYPLAVFVILATILFSLRADALCKTGKTPENITPSTNPTSWSPSVADEYAAASGIWGNANGNAFVLSSSSYPSCLDWGAYGNGFSESLDSVTYYELSSAHGCNRASCASNQCFVGGVCQDSYEYHAGQAGIEPANPAGSTIERAQIFDNGDGVSIDDSSGNVVVYGSWFRFVHDDAIELDFGLASTVTADSNYLDRVNMAFAFDLRSGQSCPSGGRGQWTLYNNIVDLHRFAHTYEEDPGHGALFKDDGGGCNPPISFVGNKVLLGPVAGDQVYFPNPSWLTECVNNIFLWDGDQTQWNVMLGYADNAANMAALSSCITVVKRFEACPGCSSAEFLAQNQAALDGQSWNYMVQAWTSGFGGGGSPPGCGIGPELAFVLPALSLLWRRRKA